jgi:hypothetical protein
MKQNKRKYANIFLILGMTFLTIGIATDNTVFTWAAIAFVLISLFLGGRWMRPRRK